jgi:hypothetical protein
MMAGAEGGEYVVVEEPGVLFGQGKTALCASAVSMMV